ncbi:MAG: hypothetical protein KAQ96_03760 [Thermoplasmata archaeon]|nr:hypothetical protein [Thermoplasmata archaeon]
MRDDDVFDKMQYPPGSFEAHHSAWYPNKQVRSARQRTHVVSPSMSFKTDVPEDKAFLKMLKVLNKAEFKWLARYRGPRIGVRVPRGQTVDADKLITALETVEIRSLPLTGIKAVLVHDRDQQVRAIVKVNTIGRTKVKLKIKGTIRFSEWRKLHTKVDKRLNADE